MLPAIKSEKSLELKKHINAIHCTNNLTLVQRKLFNALLFNAYAELPHKAQFEVPARALCALIGYNSNDYGKLKKALLALMTVALEWNVIDYSSSDSSGKWRASAVLSSAKLEDGICTYEYSTLMRDLLYRPEIYGRLDMRSLAKFKSSYGIALYENCIRFQGLSQTPWFPLEVFRRLMGVFGDKYSAFNDFKKRVLNIAIEEVNKHSTIVISPEVKRKNQKVISIRFKLLSKLSTVALPETIKDDVIEYNELEKLINLLVNDFCLSPEAVKEVFVQYEMNYIKEKVHLIMSSESFLSGKIRGLAGYLVSALRKDYKPNKTSVNIIPQRKKEIASFNKEEKKQKEELQRLYSQYENNIIDDYLYTLGPEKYEETIADFELKGMDSLTNGWYIKYKLEHPAVRSALKIYLKLQDPHIFESIMSFDEFKEKELQEAN